ncbi:MAG: DUF4870 domain-containing protein [Anaerolineae bacterium]
MSANETKPSADERVTAAIAHGVVIAYGVGAVGAAVMWLLQKEKSRYVAFQALQAAVYQLVGLLVYIIGWSCWGCLYGLSFIPMIASAERYKDAPPIFFLVSLGLMVVPLGLMGLWVLYGLWGALRAFQGRDFRYIVLGRMLERYLGQEGKTSG